jgi:signal peptidase I
LDQNPQFAIRNPQCFTLFLTFRFLYNLPISSSSVRTVLKTYFRHRRNPWLEAVETVGLAVLVSYLLRILAFQAFYIPSRSMENTLQPLDHIISEKVSYSLRSPSVGEIAIFDFGAPRGEVPGLRSAELHGAQGASADAPPGVPAVLGNAPLDREYVKRVIAVGGDEIEFRGGALYRNGKRLAENYIAPGADEPRGGFALRIPGRRVSFAGKNVLIDGAPLDRVLPPSVPPGSVEDRTARNFVRLEGGAIGILRIRVPAKHLYMLGDNRSESLDSRFFGFVPEAQVRGRALLTYWPPRRIRIL